MATETIQGIDSGFTDLETNSQIRLNLSTRHPDISLPENPGPILVNTSKATLDYAGSLS